MDWLPLAYACFCIFCAAIVRGFSGFGFSLLAITALSLVYTPAEIVPSIFMLEVAASVHLLPSIWKDVHWRSLGPLILGCVIGTPFGVYILASFPPAPMQLALSVFTVASAIILWSGFTLSRLPDRLESVGVGAFSGLCNGAFGIGGPPVIALYFATPAAVHISRATLIAFFLGTDVIGLGFQARENLINYDSFVRAAAFLPPLLIGVWIGARGFKNTNPEWFKRSILVLLVVLAIIIGLKAVLLG
jgi:uncharacterized protein